MFPIYNSVGQHGFLEQTRYPKAADPNPYVRVGIVPVTGGPITWVPINEKDDQYFGPPTWTADGKSFLIQWMNRGQDNVKVYAVDARTGLKQELYDERQPTWVSFFDDLTLLADGRGFLLRSDRDGWSHIYFYDLQGQLRKRLTGGEWAVTRIAPIDEKTGWVWFLAGAAICSA